MAVYDATKIGRTGKKSSIDLDGANVLELGFETELLLARPLIARQYAELYRDIASRTLRGSGLR